MDIHIPQGLSEALGISAPLINGLRMRLSDHEVPGRSPTEPSYRTILELEANMRKKYSIPPGNYLGSSLCAAGAITQEQGDWLDEPLRALRGEI